MDDLAKAARLRRETAALRHKPGTIKLLLVAEAPPASLDRYFYFDDVRGQDSLFRYVCRGLLGKEPNRPRKVTQLEKLRNRGVYLIDLKEEPIDGTPLEQFVSDLVERCGNLNPRKIILIKATVFDAAYMALRVAGLPVSSVRIPFPGSGRQREFEAAFRQALDQSEL